MALTQQEREWIDNHFEALSREITELKISMAVQKVKVGALSAIFGVLGGSIPVSLMIAVYFIRSWN